MSWEIVKGKREDRAKLIADASALLKTAHDETRELSVEENTKWESMHKDVDRLAAEITQLEKQGEAERSLETAIGKSMETRPVESSADVNKAFSRWIRHGKDGMTPEDRAVLANYNSECRAVSGLTLSAGSGRDFVPTSMASTFIEQLKYSGGILAAGATVLEQSSGEAFNIRKRPADHGGPGAGWPVARGRR